MHPIHFSHPATSQPPAEQRRQHVRSWYKGLVHPEAPVALVARVTVLVALFTLLEKGIRTAGHLPEDSYFQRFIVVELGGNLFHAAVDSWLLVLPAVLIAGVLVVRFPLLRRAVRGWGQSWSVLEHGQPLRFFITFVALILAWTFSSYDVNLYVDQVHGIDRLLLLALVPLLFWRPVFVFPFLLLLVAIITQFDYPLQAYPWTHPNLPIRILVLFGTAWLLHGVTGRAGAHDFLFVLCCLLAVNYWWSGLGKLRINWISHPHLNLLVFGAYANGWLTFLKPETVVRLSETMAWFNLPLMGFTLLVEWGSLVILWRRFTLPAFLVGFMLFHLGIFAVTGMFFWHWILIEAAFLVFLIRRKRWRRLPIFTHAHFLLSLLLIGGCIVWVRPPPSNLTWYDTPLTYTYRLEGVGASGATYSLPSQAFAPFADIFTLGIFMYLSPEPQLTRIWGVVPSDHALADTLLHVTTVDEVYTLEARRRAPYNAAASARFDAFIQRFFGTLNRRGSTRTWLSPVQAPRHLWSFARGRPFQMQEPLTKVIVYRVTSLYDGTRYTDIRTLAVQEITILPEGASPIQGTDSMIVPP